MKVTRHLCRLRVFAPHLNPRSPDYAGQESCWIWPQPLRTSVTDLALFSVLSKRQMKSPCNYFKSRQRTSACAPKEGRHRTALSTWATSWLECTCEPIARLHFNLGSESVFNHYWPFSDRRLTEELGHAMAWVAIAFKPLLVSNSVDNQNGLNCS